MTWIGISDHENHDFSSCGLDMPAGNSDLMTDGEDTLVVRGSLVIETRLPASRRPEPLIFYNRTGDWPLHLSLLAVPGGGLTLILDQGGEILHRTINHSEAGRTDILRITYSWDAPARRGRLALERSDAEKIVLLPVGFPKPLRLTDIRALSGSGSDRYLAPDVLYLAFSTAMEPVGPMPSLALDTPIATPHGYRPAGTLRRGDTVLTGNGEVVPVLHSLSRQVPARGGFAPVRLRAPYFGLHQDIQVAPSQRIVLSGSEVEYLFGQEAVLVPVRHLVGGASAVPAQTALTVTYTQLLLPGHEALVAAGTVAESLYIGRLRRQKARLQASILAGLDRASLPEHGRAFYPALRAFDAIVLAEQRSA